MKGSLAVILVLVTVLALPPVAVHPQVISDLVDRIRPSIGFVLTQGNDGVASGTAFVVHQEGYLITALHVVARAQTIQVRLGGQVDAAEVLAVDRGNDTALLRLPRTGLAPLSFAAAPPRTGEEIVVVGYPLADLLGAQDVIVTRGIISGVFPTRPQVLEDLPFITGSVIQVDAAMNPGVSGGPILNLRGEVVGVAVAGVRPGVATSVNFAIPSSAVQPLMARTLASPGGVARLLPLTRSHTFELAYRARGGSITRHRTLEAACLLPPPQALYWTGWEGRMTLSDWALLGMQYWGGGVEVWVSSPGGAPSDAQSSFGHLFSMLRPTRIRTAAQSPRFVRPLLRVCLNYEISFDHIVFGSTLFEARYAIEYLVWVGD